ncbi:hypothetical protein ACFFJX_14315 [Pseudarcicella hirudinis]|uniref:hypothetical protein n=1 Tax=Pseudarcicella hirudinis TaxID=1079859 RepID=UPI0035F0280A
MNGNGSFTVTVSNPTSGIGYVYYLINNNTNVQLDKKYNGSSNTFTGLSDGNYRVDVWEDRTGGGVINGNENVSLIKDCSGFSASISKNRDSNCGNRAGSVTITASGKSGGCYKYTLIGGQNQAYVKESGLISSNSWTVDDLPPGNYYAGVQFSQDCEHMSDMASTSSVALNKDCSDFTSLLSIVSLPNCENNRGAKLRITATFTESVAYPPGYKFALFEKSRSFTVPGESHPVAETTSFSTNNTWEVTTIKDFATNQQIPLPVGEYYAGISVTKDYNSVYTSGVSNTLQLNNDFTVNVQPIKGICGRNDGKLNVTINCGNGIFAIFLYKRPDNSPYRVIGSAPNFLQTRNNLIENLAAGTYDILVQELNKDGSYRRSAEMKNIILGDLPIPIKAITNKSSYCPGEQITLSAANVPAGSTYDWVGVPTDQKSQASPSFKLPSSPGYYRYFVGGKSGLCDLQVDTALVYQNSSGISDGYK